MANNLKERKDIDNSYKWNLKNIYKADDDFEKALSSLQDEVKKISSFEGKINTIEDVKNYLDFVFSFEKEFFKVYSYAFLKNSEDTREEKAKSMNKRAMNLYVELNTRVSFFEPELIKKDKAFWDEIKSSPLLEDYKILLLRIFDKKKYTLSTKEEVIMSSFTEVLSSPGEISRSLCDSDMVFPKVLNKDKKEIELNNYNFTTIEGSSDRVLRENAFKAYYKVFKDHINTLGETLGANVKKSTIEARLRGYDSSLHMASFNERVPVYVYNNLIEAVRDNISLLHRYVRLRKKMLKVDELHFYDIYAPLVKSDKKKYSYEEALSLLYDTVKIYGDTYLDAVKMGIEKGWVDVYPNKGKTGGAYSSGTYSTDPYILMNYTDTLDSVSTLLHEMGHSMQTYFSKLHNPIQYSDYTLFVAEVASTVNENLLVENLLEKTDDKRERLILLNQYLENFKGTLYRQTMFSEFEKKIHETVERGEALTPKGMSSLYKDLNRDYFGDDIYLDEEIQYEWARIPHFYSPFYVYKYATSYSAAVSLSEGIRKEKEGLTKGNIKKYIEFLSMGCKKDPLDELKHAGVDFSTKTPVEDALKKFENVLIEAEKLFDELKNNNEL